MNAAEELVRESIFIDIANKLPIGVFVLKLEDRVTREFRIVYRNNYNSKITGIPVNKFIDTLLRDSFPKVYESNLPDLYLKSIESQQVIDIGEVVYGDENIKTKTFFLKAVPIKEDHVAVLMEDVTLKKALKEIECKNKEIEQFAFIASHDLKEPLRTINSILKLIDHQYKGVIEPEVNKYHTFISQSIDRMTNLIEDLLDYSRIGHEKCQELINCNDLLEVMTSDLDTIIKENNANIIIKKLPIVNAYKVELRQLFQNLLTNAIKFRKEYESPIVEISAQKKGDYWEFCVRDNGIGIEEKYKKDIFILFQRLHNRNEYPGTGIGLSNCKKIVEYHGGKIWFKSSFGIGTSFYFTLPR